MLSLGSNYRDSKELLMCHRTCKFNFWFHFLFTLIKGLGSAKFDVSNI